MIKSITKTNMKRICVTLMLGIMMLMLILSGCGKEESKKVNKAVETSTSDNTEDTAEESSGNVEGNADAIDQIVNHIEVNGKHVDFPFTLNDLGDDYDFANYIEIGDGTYGMHLQYKGETIAYAYVVATKKNDINRDSMVIDFDIDSVQKQMITVNGIDCNSSLEEAQLSFSNLQMHYRDNGLPSSINYLDNKYVFTLYFSEEKEITGIYLTKRGE